MNNCLENFNWESLYARYDAQCKGFDSKSDHLLKFESDRPQSDRELYYRLIDCYSSPSRIDDANPVGTYQALLYWKLYSQPAARANIAKWIPSRACRLSKNLDVSAALANCPSTLERNAHVVIEAIKRLGNFKLNGMSSEPSLPVRTTFLHFLYPSTVPIFDRMVLQAVGINDKGANQSYKILAGYLPFVWQLADRYGSRAAIPTFRGCRFQFL